MAKVRVGQSVVRTPKTIGAPVGGTKVETRPMRGTVVFVHSKGRHHTVEFTNAVGAKIRESFDGVWD